MPVEIYRNILKYVDYETHKICLDVSQAFRDLCQYEVRLNEDVVFLPPDDTSVLQDLANINVLKARKEVGKLMEQPGSMPVSVTLSKNDHWTPKEESYRVMVGHQRDRRSMLPKPIALEPCKNTS